MQVSFFDLSDQKKKKKKPVQQTGVLELFAFAGCSKVLIFHHPARNHRQSGARCFTTSSNVWIPSILSNLHLQCVKMFYADKNISVAFSCVPWYCLPSLRTSHSEREEDVKWRRQSRARKHEQLPVLHRRCMRVGGLILVWSEVGQKEIQHPQHYFLLSQMKDQQDLVPVS